MEDTAAASRRCPDASRRGPGDRSGCAVCTGWPSPSNRVSRGRGSVRARAAARQRPPWLRAPPRSGPELSGQHVQAVSRAHRCAGAEGGCDLLLRIPSLLKLTRSGDAAARDDGSHDPRHRAPHPPTLCSPSLTGCRVPSICGRDIRWRRPVEDRLRLYGETGPTPYRHARPRSTRPGRRQVSDPPLGVST